MSCPIECNGSPTLRFLKWVPSQFPWSWLCMNHAETWKKLARRLIFPGSALLFTTLLYDECAHGWLDGLNRLFMEAEPDLCYCFLLKTLEPLVLPILQKCIYWNLNRCRQKLIRNWKIILSILYGKKSSKVEFILISCKKAPFYTQNALF